MRPLAFFRALVPFVIAFALLVGTAGIVTVFIESEQEDFAGLPRTDAFILLTAFCMLILVFFSSRLVGGSGSLGRKIPDIVRYAAIFGLIFLLPRHAGFYEKISQAVHSEIALFAIYSIVDIAVGRMMFALVKGRKALPPSRSSPHNQSASPF